MNIKKYKSTVLSWSMLKIVLCNFISFFGFLALLLGVGDILWPQTFNYGENGFKIIIFVSVFFALIKSFPKLASSFYYSIPGHKIEIIVGDLFSSDKKNIVIGMSDTFDTEIGEIISKESIQGQFLEKIYRSDKSRLDRDLKIELDKLKLNPKIDKEKTIGKNERYDIGTTVCIRYGSVNYFCCGYSFMNNNLMAKSSFEELWISLGKIWNMVRIKGERNAMAMPVIGSNLARIENVNYNLLIKSIILSYVVNSRLTPISKELSIIINELNAEKINFLEIQNFLENLDK